ncbi:MAG: exodeoxyribonuclease VII large subunit [Candidatus Aminicenantes bacterium]|nr:exodeoxyribonuclease VII large subunit [Candidatus Aminicenantes bacterium]
MTTVQAVLADKVFTVSQVTHLVKETLETAFPQLWVEGEVSNFSRAQSGHLYFNLKDERSILGAVMFRSNSRGLRFELKDGLQVLCKGRLNVYEPQGKYQLIVELAEPKGKGALQLAFEQLKEKLRAEGLFDPGRKKKLPLLPKTIGLVTSPRGAAIADIIRTLKRRFAALHILLYPVKVQGQGAAEEIVEALDYFAGRPEVDVLIVGRGGGSIEDLWAFNEEKVARAIVRCPIPIISAVGHEVDFTIADFVADVRASTPSVAAEMVVDKEASFRERIENLAGRIRTDLRLSLEMRRQRVFSLTHHRSFQSFRLMLLNLDQRVDDLETRVWDFLRREQQKVLQGRSRLDLAMEKARHAVGSRLRELRNRWEQLGLALDAASPLTILKKGYTLCFQDGGRVLIRRVEDVRPVEDLTVLFYKGELTCRVKAIDRTRRVDARLDKE